MRLATVAALFSACSPTPIIVTPPTCYCVAQPAERERVTEKSPKGEKHADELGRQIEKARDQVQNLKGITEESSRGGEPRDPNRDR
jgi:hypothetical protein